MSYTHNMHAEYRDVALQAREEASEGRKEFLKLVGASGFSVLAAAACGGSAGSSVSGGAAAAPSGGAGDLALNDYENILAPQSNGWYHLSAYREGYVHMNYGTVGSNPNTVLAEMTQWHRDVAENPAGPLPWQVNNSVIRAECSVDMYNVLPQEMCCSFNTTDSMCKIFAGIKWNKGDAILITNNEHGGGLGPCHAAANRYGAKILQVNVPTGVSKGAGTGGYAEDGTLVKRFQKAYDKALAIGLTPRAMMISSPPYTLGWRLEEKALCQWAWQNKLLAIVDGAHICGQLPIDLHAMGCDYFGATAAKWHCGPGQTGYMYVRMGKAGMTPTTTFSGYKITAPEWANPNDMEPFYINSAGYSNHLEGQKGYHGKWDITKGEDLGSSLASTGNANYPTLKTLYEINKLWKSIGRANIAKYNQSLAQYLRQAAAQNDKMGLYSLGVDFQTPAGVVPTGAANETKFPVMLQTGITGINPFSPGKDYNADLTPAQSSACSTASRTVVNRLKQEYGIGIRNSSTPYQLRSNPEASAIATEVSGQATAKKNVSSPLRISTHFYTRVSDVDRLMEALNRLL